jgi:hypothetical protein
MSLSAKFRTMRRFKTISLNSIDTPPSEGNAGESITLNELQGRSLPGGNQTIRAIVYADRFNRILLLKNLLPMESE